MSTSMVHLLKFMIVLGWLAAPASAATLRVPADHPTITKAIEAAQWGDTILVDAGIYKESLVLKPGVHLRSRGGDEKGKLGLARAEATIVDGGGIGKSPGVTMAEGATLDGFTITNIGAYDEQKWKHHHATQGNEQKHEHIGALGVPAVAVLGVNCTVIGNMVHHNGDTGIGIRGEKGKTCTPRIARNITYRNMGGGIGSMNHSSAIIEGNTCFENFYAGIGHNNASPLVVGNECFGNIRAGIGISEGSSPVVRGNKCHHNRRAGIGIRTGETTSPIIEDNECHDNDMAGIGAEEHATPVIRRNQCHRNAMAGIGAQDGARPLIIGNECRENRSAGIGARTDAAPLVLQNHSHHNEQSGIGVETKAKVLIIGNRCDENRLVAIGIPDGGHAFIHGNELSRTGGMPPLLAVRGGSKVVLTQNTLRGGGVACVMLQGDAVAYDNHLISATGNGSGFWASERSNLSLFHNRIEGFGQGVRATGSAVTLIDNTAQGFKKSAFLVEKPSQPPVVVRNRAISAVQTDQAAIVEEPRGIVEDNQVIAPAASPTGGAPKP